MFQNESNIYSGSSACDADDNTNEDLTANKTKELGVKKLTHVSPPLQWLTTSGKKSGAKPKLKSQRNILKNIVNKSQTGSCDDTRKITYRQSKITKFAIVSRNKPSFNAFEKCTAPEDESVIAIECQKPTVDENYFCGDAENISVGFTGYQSSVTNSDLSLGKRICGLKLVDDVPTPKRSKQDASQLESSSDISTSPDDNKLPPDSAFDQNYSLKVVARPGILTAGFACIAVNVFARLVRSMNSENFHKKFILIDCRYPYEYEAGHVKGALNIFDPVVLEQTFFPDCIKKLKQMISKIPIFYCEYSEARAPLFASHLRKSDRVRNFVRYPQLLYEEIYVLEGGYRSFYQRDNNCNKNLCDPDGYLPMAADECVNELKKYKEHNLRRGIGFGVSMFETALIKKKGALRRSRSNPIFLQQPDSPTSFTQRHLSSPNGGQIIPMLIDPKTPTGRKRADKYIDC